MEKIVISEDTVKAAKELNEKALEEIFSAFKPKIKAITSKYFLSGSDREDVTQEAMIALFSAIKNYNYEKNNNFFAFAVKCIDLRMKTAVRNSLRKKHSPLNQFLSIDEKPELGVKGEISDPEEEYINNESYSIISEKLKALLSDYEILVVSMLSVGMKCGEIAKVLGKTSKSVDNAIQRIRKKADELF